MADRFPGQSESNLTFLVDQNNSDRMIKQLLNSLIAKYRDLSVSRRLVICLSLRLRQIIDLLADNKSRYFGQPHSIIDNYNSCLATGNKMTMIVQLETSEEQLNKFQSSR